MELRNNEKLIHDFLKESGKQTNSNLTEKLDLKVQNVSAYLRNLVALDLVKTEIDKNDKRIIWFSIK